MATLATRKVRFVRCNQLADDNNLTNVYLAYTAEGAEQAMRPQTAKSGRPKTASKGRNARRSLVVVVTVVVVAASAAVVVADVVVGHEATDCKVWPVEDCE